MDAGTSATPRDAILPALRRLGIRGETVRYLVVTHPDLDHQGGLSILKQELPNAVAACGFADRGLVSEPERLVTDRYGAYEREHGVAYTDAEKESIRDLYGSPVSIDVTFAGGEQIELGDRQLSVLHAPGHSAGHLVLYTATTCSRRGRPPSARTRGTESAFATPSRPPIVLLRLMLVVCPPAYR